MSQIIIITLEVSTIVEKQVLSYVQFHETQNVEYNMVQIIKDTRRHCTNNSQLQIIVGS